MAEEIIRLNVGGRLMTTTRTTLTKHKDSLLEKMFQEDSPLPPARLVDGAFFIDADPDVFCVILTWLRHGIIELKAASVEHLKAAASFFGLWELEAAIQDQDDIVTLNVRGRLIMTTRTTLTFHKGSRLEKWFREGSPSTPPRLHDGSYGIDTDPDVFCIILTWLQHESFDSKGLSLEHLKKVITPFELEGLRAAINREIENRTEKQRCDDEDRHYRTQYHQAMATVLAQSLEGGENLPVGVAKSFSNIACALDQYADGRVGSIQCSLDTVARALSSLNKKYTP